MAVSLSCTKPIRFCIFICSGGKDSCYNMMQCVIEGHKIVALANLRPEKKGNYMYCHVTVRTVRIPSSIAWKNT